MLDACQQFWIEAFSQRQNTIQIDSEELLKNIEAARNGHLPKPEYRRIPTEVKKN